MIDKKRVARIADLAMLKLDEEELALFTEKLEVALEYFSQIAALDTSGAEGIPHGAGLDGPLRDDAAAACTARNELMANTEYEQDGFFRV